MAEVTNLPPSTPTGVVSTALTPDGVPTGQPTAAPVKADQVIKTDIPTKPEDKPVEKKVEPPKPDETKEDAKIDINDFLEAAGKDLKPLEKEEDKPVEPKVEKQKRITRDEQVKQDKATRDITDIEDKELAQYLLDEMSRKSFDKIKPIITEHKKLKIDLTNKEVELKTTQDQFNELKSKGPQLPESYYDHESGYLLDPVFQGNVKELSITQAILNHWQKQARDVAEGAAEFDMLDWDRNGNLAITGKVKADKGIEMQLMGYINHAQNLVNTSNAKMQAVMMQHKDKSQSKLKSLTDFTQQAFSALFKPENKAIYEPLIKQKYEQFSEHKGNPLLHIVAPALVMTEVLGKLLQQSAELLKQQKAVETNGHEKKVEEKNRLNPTGDEIAGDGGKENKGDPNITVDDFERVKQGI